jgi:hypothetical protein
VEGCGLGLAAGYPTALLQTRASTIESPAEAQSFLRQPKQEYHKRTITEESAQVHNLPALRPSASARWSSAVDGFGFAVIIDD